MLAIMANNRVERQPSGEGAHQPDATDLGPNEQTVLSQQTAPNRTPSDQVEALRGAGSVGRGDQPEPAPPHVAHDDPGADPAREP